jgi:soluble lytic murein transglycosylase-like protein
MQLWSSVRGCQKRRSQGVRCFVSLMCFAGFGVAASVNATCWNEAATRYSVDPLLLKAIAWQESRGRPGAIGPALKDGNRAIGLMQINTIHLPTLEKFGISREDLFDACVSIEVGAWVLADCIERKGATWAAVGCYYGGPNSKAYDELARYVLSVQRHYAGYAATHPSHSAQRSNEPHLSGEHRAPEITFITSR